MRRVGMPGSAPSLNPLLPILVAAGDAVLVMCFFANIFIFFTFICLY
jgi:hypothetical protein